MSISTATQPLFRDLFDEAAVAARGGRAAAGMFLCNGDANTAEICAGAGFDYLLIDAEHAPLTLADVLGQLRTVAAYRVPTMVRVPALDPVLIKQFLDVGAQTLLVPMVDDAEAAAVAVAAARYPGVRGGAGAGAAGAGPADGAAVQAVGERRAGGGTAAADRRAGVRGVGSALARSGRWNRIDGYLTGADEHVSVVVQVETAAGVANAGAIAAVDGIDAVFVGPSDLSASMGLLGQQAHPEVVAAVESVIREVKAAGKVVGVNAFVPEQAEAYVAAGADFVNVGADVAILARGSEALAARWCTDTAAQPSGDRASY
ncbi:MAG: aldolase/citrate lyase family protein [Micrococcus sp.]|nr:aldolase/citrate lyase family protein [Micrococcus sp.]